LRDPQFSWDPLFLKSFIFRHATVAWMDSFFLQAAANFLRDPQFPRGQFLWLSASPCSRLSAPTPLPSFDRFHYGIFPEYLMMLLHGLHHFWIRHSLYYMFKNLFSRIYIFRSSL
jgi:hypothetical protein